MEPYDRCGIPIAEYPLIYQNSRLLGINGDGIAEYLRPTGAVFLAEFDDEGELRTPPEFGPSHEIRLESFGWSLGEYLAASMKERGDWRVLTGAARHALDGEATGAGTKSPRRD